MKNNKVYVVTTMRFGYKWFNKTRSKDGYYHSYYKQTSPNQEKYFSTLSHRTWGWYSKLKDAQECVNLNSCDIYEGEYNYAVIEEISEGVLQGGEIPKEWWYKWEGDWETGKYKPCEKPKEYEGYIVFMDQINRKKI
jgi:hypothetical protein